MTAMAGDPHLISFNKDNVSEIADKVCGSNIIVRQPTAAHGRLGLFFVCDTNTFVFASDVTPVIQMTSVNNNDNLAVSAADRITNDGALRWTVLVSIAMALVAAYFGNTI
jgi:hypothetical protein